VSDAQTFKKLEQLLSAVKHVSLRMEGEMFVVRVADMFTTTGTSLRHVIDEATKGFKTEEPSSDPES
jgi:hypothetical protein